MYRGNNIFLGTDINLGLVVNECKFARIECMRSCSCEVNHSICLTSYTLKCSKRIILL